MKKFIVLLALILTAFSQAQKKENAIHVEVIGKGKPILFIPGFAIPGSSWHATVAHLKDDYECHLVTLAGFGGTKPIDFPWLPKVNEAILEYIQTKHLNDLTVIGHSLGGTIATWLASHKDLKLSKIILIDALPATGALMIPNFDPNKLVYDNTFNKRQLSMSKTDFDKMANGFAQNMSINVKSQNKIKEWLASADRKTYVYGYTDYLRLDMRNSLKNINLPVTIIAAALPYGKNRVRQTYQNQYRNLEKYDFIIADNSAHFIMFDEPDWFLKQIKKSLTLN